MLLWVEWEQNVICSWAGNCADGHVQTTENVHMSFPGFVVTVATETPWSSRACQLNSCLVHWYCGAESESAHAVGKGCLRGKGRQFTNRICILSDLPATQSRPTLVTHSWHISHTALTWKSDGFSREEAAPGQQEEDRCFQQWILTQPGEFGEVERGLKIYKKIIIQNLTLCIRLIHGRNCNCNTYDCCGRLHALSGATICRQREKTSANKKQLQKVLTKPGDLPCRVTHWV